MLLVVAVVVVVVAVVVDIVVVVVVVVVVLFYFADIYTAFVIPQIFISGAHSLSSNPLGGMGLAFLSPEIKIYQVSFLG